MVTTDFGQEYRLNRYHYRIHLIPLTASVGSLSQATDILSDTLKEQGVIDEANKVFEKYPYASQVLIYAMKRYNVRWGVYEEYPKWYLIDRGTNKIYRNKEEHLIIH